MKKYVAACLPGIREWLEASGLIFENPVGSEVPFNNLKPGDSVYGCLGIISTAEICQKGARAFLVEYSVPEERYTTGKIDWKTEIYNFNPRIVEYYVEKR